MKRKLINTMKQEQIKLIKNLSMNKETLKNTAYFLGWSIRHTRRKLMIIKKMELGLLSMETLIKFHLTK